MTERQKEFARHYARGTPIRDAVLMAGYSDRNLPQMAARLLADREVSAFIEQIKAERKNKSFLTKQQCGEVLSKIAVDTESSASEKIKAVGMLIDIQPDTDDTETSIVFEIDFGDKRSDAV